MKLKENELISILSDNTMKIWKLNRETKFKYIKKLTFIFKNQIIIILIF